MCEPPIRHSLWAFLRNNNGAIDFGEIDFEVGIKTTNIRPRISFFVALFLIYMQMYKIIF